MKKEEYRRWFSDQLLLQNRLLIGAIAAMAGLSVVATLMEGTLFASVLRIGFIGSWTMAILIRLMSGAMCLVLHGESGCMAPESVADWFSVEQLSQLFLESTSR